MADGERKSSDDLIREANLRLRGAGDTHPVPPGKSPATEIPPAESRGGTTQEPAYRESRTPDCSPEIDVRPVDDRPRSWISGRLIRWVVSGLILGGIYLFSSLGEADRDGSGEIVGGGDLDVMSLQVGDCFDDPEELEEMVFDVAAVPCSEPHDNEVFAVQSLASAFPGDTFPGPDPLWEHSYEICSGSLFDAYVGIRYLDSSLDVFSFTPTAESWDQGDRDFVCALYRLDFAKLTGTTRGSGL